ncbi:inactive glutathione S-transferase D3-like [Schistocerca cancellata]|uniref:inactive glutathione S-transferase D3-like n=1 Tax=Schistocerca cancellata TaxID=274614 RepID=UPI002118E875|nr:inactive glutathione S-transferase D3-like [Schistocerca cancellata]
MVAHDCPSDSLTRPSVENYSMGGRSRSSVKASVNANRKKSKKKGLNANRGGSLPSDPQEKFPQHTKPALEDNGLYLAESRSIAMYLISKYAKDDSLYPKDVNKRVLVDQRLFFDQDLYNRIFNVFRPKFYGEQVDTGSIDKVNEGLETLNRMLDGKQWLAGDKITLADYAVANSLSALEFVPESGIDPTKQPNIKEWLPRVESSHPKYGESLKELREGFKKMEQK